MNNTNELLFVYDKNKLVLGYGMIRLRMENTKGLATNNTNSNSYSQPKTPKNPPNPVGFNPTNDNQPCFKSKLIRDNTPALKNLPNLTFNLKSPKPN